ncbi:unnamed protein product, partial [Callosobruchus maculatus]
RIHHYSVSEVSKCLRNSFCNLFYSFIQNNKFPPNIFAVIKFIIFQN